MSNFFDLDAGLAARLDWIARQAQELDESAFLAGLNLSLFADELTLGRAAQAAVAAGKVNLLRFAAAEVLAELESSDVNLCQAALQAVAAVVLADDLDEADAAALALPWSLGYVPLSDVEHSDFR